LEVRFSYALCARIETKQASGEPPEITVAPLRLGGADVYGRKSVINW
jgi:hypothetical protein